MTTVAYRGQMPAREVLPNGLVVIASESHATPAVTISASVRAGSVHDPAPLPGLAYFASRVLDRGTTLRTADAIAEELDGRGVTLTVRVTRHLFNVSCTCLAEDFDSMLDLVGDVVMRPTFPEQEVETRRREIVTAIRQDEDNPAAMAYEGVLGLLYPGGHPYGRRLKGTVTTIEAVMRQALQEFHSTRFSPSALSLVVVGDVTAAQVVEAAGRTLGEWRGPSVEEGVLPPAPNPAERRRLVIPMMNKAQADIAYGLIAIRRLDPAYHAFVVLNNVLGQYALGGRLGDSIRERQGMAYYVFSSFDGLVGESPLLIRAGVNPQNVDRTLASIDEELSAMMSSGITERELRESKQYLIGSMPLMLETSAGIAAFLQTVEYFGLGLDYDRRLPSLIGEVRQEQVNELARRFLAPERAAVVVAGPYEGR
jgi:zinc protease